jgi:hypothetical protein
MSTAGAPIPAALPLDPAHLPFPCTLLDLGDPHEWALTARLLSSVLHLTAQSHERLAPAPPFAAAARCVALYAGRHPTNVQLAASKKRLGRAQAEALRPRTVAQLAARAPARRARMLALAAQGWEEATPPPLPYSQGMYMPGEHALPPHPLAEAAAAAASAAKAAAAAALAGGGGGGGAAAAAAGAMEDAEAASGATGAAEALSAGATRSVAGAPAAPAAAAAAAVLVAADDDDSDV